jgi:hypothetical protein
VRRLRHRDDEPADSWVDRHPLLSVMLVALGAVSSVLLYIGTKEGWFTF